MIGVVIVTFQSADVIERCLESLRTSEYQNMRVVICDNNSQDETLDVIAQWAQKHAVEIGKITSDKTAATHQFALYQTGGNLGFAAAVNSGIEILMKDTEIDLFWVLNPDCEVTPKAAGAFAKKAKEAGPFALMGGRIRYADSPNAIQSDGGLVARWSGICSNRNQGLPPEQGTMPTENSLDFISGANMFASREFIKREGLMTETYFLYYEEVDWAARRGDLPLIWCSDAEVFHEGGTAIGTGSPSRRASPFANYFNYRNRMRFVAKFTPWALPTTWFLSMLRVLKLILLGATDEAFAAARGLNGLAPPKPVRDRIADQDQKYAFTDKRAGTPR